MELSKRSRRASSSSSSGGEGTPRPADGKVVKARSSSANSMSVGASKDYLNAFRKFHVRQGVTLAPINLFQEEREWRNAKGKKRRIVLDDEEDEDMDEDEKRESEQPQPSALAVPAIGGMDTLTAEGKRRPMLETCGAMS